ncbi:hypothetical protein N7495_008296 [Penicillium taxi]|uniref:uncharacterized protein n=1 Tax=Penicillium taxi TaxID=168475 RepID=UPI0025455C68|nr:uncharacterized protein N7495_008296 [Penicillium taxi]KAJ5888255.1 hypothetical protein N7495_008296 [Penicillium taxi]
MLRTKYLGTRNCYGGCKLCPPGLNIEISGGSGGGGGGSDDDDDTSVRKTTVTESAYITTKTVDDKLTTITESATTTTETETESRSTESSTTLTAGIAIGTYTAFAETSGVLDATTEPIASLQALASTISREFSSLYSAEISSLTAGLYTTTTSISTTSTSKTTTTKTTVTVPTVTEYCAKYVVENEDTTLDKYGSKYYEFIFAMWGISWPEADNIKTDITDMLSKCDVSADIDVVVDTARWGTIAMWNNGENYALDSCIAGTIESLGGSKPACKWIYKEGEEDFSAQDSAEEEMVWIYEYHSSVVTSPYPLTT